jgi:hypothetical protein
VHQFEIRRRRSLITALGWNNPGLVSFFRRNAESVGQQSAEFANAFSVTTDLLKTLTQGCSNPGLKLANAFGVVPLMHHRRYSN